MKRQLPELLRPYLDKSEFIDFDDPNIQNTAKQLASQQTNIEAIVLACFEFVRDEIQHTSDFKLNTITCKASDVLHYRTGYCYAKSHLLAALLRANGIPTSLMYQRLLLDESNNLFCLHGLNAVFLSDIGWFRLDPRGNTHKIKTEFSPPNETLAFRAKFKGELNCNTLFAEPLEVVTDALGNISCRETLDKMLPDLSAQQLKLESEFLQLR